MVSFIRRHIGLLLAALFLALSPFAPVDGIPRVRIRALLSRRQAGPPSAAACPAGSSICVAMNLPSDAPKDIFMKVTGSTKTSYTGIGLGPSMTNTLMVLLFPADGTLTASMRLSSGHSRPGKNADPNIKVELLDGTVVKGDSFVANIKCTGCRQWSSGSLAETNGAGLIYASGSATGKGDAAVTTYHFLGRGRFQLDLEKAKGPGGVPASASPYA
ncbi:hypothetical protein BCR37DRAFT_378335 [Protomyces lactucae-debilis]|uniref:Cellobiose dehydrogenase-like cytochrome domain-containing protein n=1 Tax=Protomyces lactucae-debilis TaxID=2754530 RepID=A0A1Y2FK26_PROLT|nr:uncharacterized protein BCR37DRAFT_378335 [Protomyces lactucae-debilis]ORY84323.1 hypothetical protein BCR37DRAFT_378335 [Protomyces lactucae-debilis]